MCVERLKTDKKEENFFEKIVITWKSNFDKFFYQI